MGNQQMTYSTNPRDGSYADTRMLYESGNYGSNHPQDDSNTIVRNIVEEIIDSACERSDPISDGAKLAPDGDQVPFNLRLFSDQSDQVEYCRGNPRNANYLESEETDSITIQNILESSKYEPFKSSNEDVFVDSVEGQYHPYSLVKLDDSNNNIEDNCSKGEDFAIASVNRHNSDCLDSKYFKDNLISNNENSNFDQFKGTSKEITNEQELSAENIIVEDSKYVNIENDSITNEKFIYNNISKDIIITPSLESSVVSNENLNQKELYFSTDLNSNIEPIVKNSLDVDESKESQSEIINSNDNVISSISDKKDFEELNPLKLDVPETINEEKCQKNLEEKPLILDSSHSKKKPSSPVEEFASIVKEICSTIEENDSKSQEIFRDISVNYALEESSKVEEISVDKLDSEPEESPVSIIELGKPSNESTFNTKEDACTIEQIKSILQEICSSVEDKTKEIPNNIESSSSLKENLISNLTETSTVEAPIFTEICSAIEDMSCTLKEKSYIEVAEPNAAKENIITVSEQCGVIENQSLNRENVNCGENIACVEDIKIDYSSKKEGRVSSEISASSNDNCPQNNDNFIEKSSVETFSSDEISTCVNNSFITKEINNEQHDAKSFDQCTNNQQKPNSTVEEMLSLFKEICSSVENTCLQETNNGNFQEHSQDCNKNKDTLTTMESNTPGSVPKSPILDDTKSIRISPFFEEIKSSQSNPICCLSPEETKLNCPSGTEEIKSVPNISSISTEMTLNSSSLIPEETSSSDYPSVFEENSSPYILEEDSSTDEVLFQLAPESVENISETTNDKLKENIPIKESSSENFKVAKIVNNVENTPDNSKNTREQQMCHEEFSSSVDNNTKDKNLYGGDHICDLNEVITQFRQKHSTDIRNPNTQITRTTKFQEGLSIKNKNRLTNNKKLNSLGSSPNKEYSNAPLIWSKELEKTKNTGEKCPENRIVIDANPKEKIENPCDTKGNNPDKQEIKEYELKEYEKDEKNLNTKPSSICKLQEEKECNTTCDWSNERNELYYQLKNLNQTQKITRFIVKELINLISLWMEDSRRENMELKECKQKLIFERDQAIEDLRSVENAFSDLHRRYEKSKTMIEEFKENENRLKQQITEGTEKLTQQKEIYKLLKKRSEERIEEANAEIINIEKSKETEIAVLKAQLRKAEMKANSIEKNLEQKIRENTELSSICEDLIAKVSKK